MKNTCTANRYVSGWPTAVMIAFIAMALMGGFACTDEETPGNGSDLTDTGTDSSDTGTDVGEADTGEEDVDTGPIEPIEPCDDPDYCEDEQTCYHGECFETCSSILDCQLGQHCTAGRCADNDCDDLECDNGYTCYRGACYDVCTGSVECGIQDGITCVDGGCVPLLEQCEGLECDQVTCPDDQTTSVTGTVNIPSGDYPLPNVTVYVPTTELAPLPEGATCATCEELLSGDPLLQNITDVEGRFELPNFPVAEEVPLVIQTGKWRREVTVSNIQPCVENELSTAQTRLPRNQSEGSIPRIAVAAGGCDNLECLVQSIGLDESEFSTRDGDGSVHLFSGSGGSSSFQSGEQFTDAEDFWEDAAKLVEYDIFLDSCECSANRSNKSDIALMAFEYFLTQGGRAFLSHYQYVWLRDNFGEIGELAEWNPSLSTSGQFIQVRTDHEEGQEMHDWLNSPSVDALNASGQMPITQPRNSILALDETLTTEWLFFPIHSTYTEQTPNYFSFNMPLGTEGDDSCGRAVFADLHVSSGSSQPFPNSCSSGDLSPQEKALIYMVFDLSACIAPECEPLGCESVKGECGIHSDHCGGIVQCGPCCSDEGQACTDDSHCCSTLSCDEDLEQCVEQ